MSAKLTLSSGASFKVTKKKKALSVNSEQVVHEYIEVLCPLLVLAAQKYFESLLRKHQRVGTIVSHLVNVRSSLLHLLTCARAYIIVVHAVRLT